MHFEILCGTLKRCLVYPMKLATMVDLVPQSVIFVREYMRLLAKVVHELKVGLIRIHQSLGKVSLRQFGSLGCLLIISYLLRILLTNGRLDDRILRHLKRPCILHNLLQGLLLVLVDGCY